MFLKRAAVNLRLAHTGFLGFGGNPLAKLNRESHAHWLHGDPLYDIRNTLSITHRQKIHRDK
jgi:hypothetical protein